MSILYQNCSHDLNDLHGHKLECIQVSRATTTKAVARSWPLYGSGARPNSVIRQVGNSVKGHNYVYT